jgi:hypothetical protein
MSKRLQFRRGLASEWTSANPVLSSGEIGFETDTNKFKIGNGTLAWSALSYFINSAAISTTLGSYVTSISLTSTLSNYVTSINLTSTLSSYVQSSVLTSTLLNYGPKYFTINPQTASYTLVALDDSKLIEISNASANTITVPAYGTTPFTTGTQINIVQTGAGQTTITPATIATTTYSSGGALGATTVVVASATGIAIGQLITGTGLAANTLVTNVSGTTITFDTATTGQIAGSLVFKVGVVGTPTLKLRTKYSSATLIKRSATDGWILIGDLSAT